MNAQHDAVRKAFTRETITNFATNAFLNGLCAWLLFGATAGAPTDFWNVLIDLSITCFCVCTITTFFCAAAGRRLVRAGIVVPRASDGSLVADLPGRTYLLGASLVGLSTCPSVLVVGFLFTLTGVTMLPPLAFIAYKALFGGVLGTLVCRIVLQRMTYATAGAPSPANASTPSSVTAGATSPSPAGTPSPVAAGVTSPAHTSTPSPEYLTAPELPQE